MRDPERGSLKFIDLFAGLGGFHLALRRLGHECVFASEIDEELRELYIHNFPWMEGKTFGDIRLSKASVPIHDVLCAGFPCQPFSKSGDQRGLQDPTRGTLFHEVAEILKNRQPHYVFLENVGNFERHDGGKTWDVVRRTLVALGYCVRGTTHVRSGGHGLVSPHHLGYPHHRERFFVVASRTSLPADPFPPVSRSRSTSLSTIVQAKSELSVLDRKETTLSQLQIDCINHWNRLLMSIPGDTHIQSPIWSDEWGAAYPYRTKTPFSLSRRELRRVVRRRTATRLSKDELLQFLPSYARTPKLSFPDWKVDFIRENREWFEQVHRHVPQGWLRDLRQFAPSLRKLEWNCHGDPRDLWRCVLQFRPSGLRAKRYASSPSLVAMTTTQIPILGPKHRFLTRVEGLRLQGFPDTHELPRRRQDAFAALGNAVHVEVVGAIAKRLLRGGQSTEQNGPPIRVRENRQTRLDSPIVHTEGEIEDLFAALRGASLARPTEGV